MLPVLTLKVLITTTADKTSNFFLFIGEYSFQFTNEATENASEICFCLAFHFK